MLNRAGISSLSQMSQVLEYLYLSGAQPLRHDRIRSKKITCIVNATTEEPSMYLPGVDYMKCRVDDSPYSRLDSYFDIVAEKIKQIKDQGGRVLVHCVAGVSRSATLVIAYLMRFEFMSLRQAFYHVKSIRPIIRPNPGFWRQLIEYEVKLFGRNTVKLSASKWGDDVPDVYTEELKSNWVPLTPTFDKGINTTDNGLKSATIIPASRLSTAQALLAGNARHSRTAPLPKRPLRYMGSSSFNNSFGANKSSLSPPMREKGFFASIYDADFLFPPKM